MCVSECVHVCVRVHMCACLCVCARAVASLKVLAVVCGRQLLTHQPTNAHTKGRAVRLRHPPTWYNLPSGEKTVR